MRITIIPSDNVVTIDGLSVHDLDLSTIAPNVHAVQWYGNAGEVEIMGEFGRMKENNLIASMSDYQSVVDQAIAAKAIIEAAAAQAAEEQAIIEV